MRKGDSSQKRRVNCIVALRWALFISAHFKNENRVLNTVHNVMVFASELTLHWRISMYNKRHLIAQIHINK